MKKTLSNKNGFTLIESVCVVAIIVILSSVIIISIGDHIGRAKRAAAVLENNNVRLAAIDQEVYGVPAGYERLADPDELARASNRLNELNGAGMTGGGGSAVPASGSGSGSSNGGEGPGPAEGEAVINDEGSGAGGGGSDAVSGAGGVGGSDAVAGGGSEAGSEAGGSGGSDEAAEPSEEVPEETPHETAVNMTANVISSYATAHNVTYLEGTEDLPRIIAEAEVTAVEMYEEGGYTGPRYFTYCPATGVTALANGNGTYMQQDIGQNLLKAYLKDAAAEATEGSNVRGRLDNAFLSDSSRCIYIGVNQLADGSIQVVPNLCVDTLGNFNTVITFRYSNSTTDRVTWSGNGGWNSYVNYVTNRSGDMLDTSVIDTSAYTRTSSASHDNPIWQAAINDLRNSYS